MRLKQHEVESIKKSFLEVFRSGEIYLFGSRIDDNKKGGDIDLYISSKDENLLEKKIDFLVKLKQRIGLQKIDVVLDRGKNNLIDKIAKKGILIARIE